MIEHLRTHFNKDYSKAKQTRVLSELTQVTGKAPDFQISQSPIFLTLALKQKLKETCEAIIDQVFKLPSSLMDQAVPSHLKVPNCSARPHFLAIDFALCQDKEADVIPQLIELQGFPSLMAFQYELTKAFVSTYPFLESLEPSWDLSNRLELLKSVLLGPYDPKEVVLLELFPQKQKTQIDFALTEHHFGIRTLCITEIKKEGKTLYYTAQGKKHPIRRLYNRVIFDELARHPHLDLAFNFQDDLDLDWVTHPDWFFKISKNILPELEHRYIPKSYRLSEFEKRDELDTYVLKPLFSFAGSGVNLEPTQSDLDQIKDPENYILQKKVRYAPLFKDLESQYSKAEIRLLYLWPDNAQHPVLFDTIVRMTKSNMANMDFNKKQALWTGSSAAFFAP